MTSSEIRQSFLDFFKSKQHTIVPSSSLMPDSPNLLFTNAGMNQFVPIFLGQRAADVSKWAGAIPGKDTRAADTQKCIRAGGKHNDLEDVGLDTYHHTFFEMLGNWSFGDYFKKEAIEWAWELITEVWKFPKNRLYATVYSPDKATGDPSEFDQEAYDFWAEKFRATGLDPKVHIVYGNKKDNFWMMGDTGPCGPCSEIHVDLTPQADTKGRLVNKGDARCIEIWNLVFIQFNAEPDGPEEAAKMGLPNAKPGVDWRQRFVPLPAKHVDTGMGFERVTGIIQNTKGFTDFTRVISNYETDVFRPIFDKLEKLSGKTYGSTLPTGKRLVEDKEVPAAANNSEAKDIAFRVIADHLRMVCFAIADGVEPGNGKREYVVRRVLRRAARYGRSLGLHEPVIYKLVDVLVENIGRVFSELRARRNQIERVICLEEEAFNRTLDRGLEFFEDYAKQALLIAKGADGAPLFDGQWAFTLYDTYGFPYDLTELLARERGMTVDKVAFETFMELQKTRARAAQKKQVIELSQIETTAPTQFVGYDHKEGLFANVLEVVESKGKTAVILDTTPFYAEMGGQVGDTGLLGVGASLFEVVSTSKSGDTFLHFLKEPDAVVPRDEKARATVDYRRRVAIERHHTVTHLFHWALHEVVSRDASQKGSYVGPEKLTFDFNCAPLTPQQLRDIEKLVNERILENALVSWTEVSYTDVKSRKDVMQFFGDKYGDKVRVVQIGGRAGELDGYSMELCGGTHTRATGEIGSFRIVAESAIAAGVRRVEAIAGLEAYKQANEQLQLVKAVAGKVNSPVGELEKKIESLLAQQKELEKQLKAANQKQSAETARSLVIRSQTIGSTKAIIANLGLADGDLLQSVADSLKSQKFDGVVVLGGALEGAVSFVVTVNPELTKQIQAGKIIQAIAPIVGGKGGGKPDNARGGGKDVAKLDEALAKARELLLP